MLDFVALWGVPVLLLGALGGRLYLLIGSQLAEQRGELMRAAKLHDWAAKTSLLVPTRRHHMSRAAAARARAAVKR